MDQTIRDLIKQGDRLFAGRTGLISAWQVIAENFYPMRADFNGFLSDDNSSSSLFSSYPVLAHRELGNMFAAMLRPRAARWFSLHAMDSTSLLDIWRLIFAHSCVWRRAGPSGGIPGPLAHLSHRGARAHNPRHNLFSALGHCSLYRLHLRNLRYVRIRLVLWTVLTLTRFTGRVYSCKNLS